MYIKRSELLKLKDSKEYKRINERFNKGIFEKLNRYDVFLSHATDDVEVMKESKAYFEQQGMSVYVAELEDPIDKKDEDGNITKQHVKIIQEAMDISDSFCYVLSKCERISTWMPWELGYFNGKYGNKKEIMVLSIYNNKMSEEKEFAGHEYLKLYPHKISDKLYTLMEELEHAINYKKDT